MQPEETVSRSPVYKPLHLLTEDDISQLTREDCRRFLKEKGMRRPSWNKSQAIQQVILLKALYETTSESDDTEAPKTLNIPCPQNPTRGPDFRITVSADDSTPTNNPYKPDVPDDTSAQLITAENDSVSPRSSICPINADAINEPVGQMTIFYRGKVNVYDDVPDDKAQTIVQFAASPFFLPHQASSDVVTTLWPFSPLPCHLHAAATNSGPNSPAPIFPRLQPGRI